MGGKPGRIARPALSLAFVAFLLLAATGCSVIRATVRMPGEAVHAVMPGSKAAPFDPAALQADLQRFSDEYASRTAAALDEYARRVGTQEARSQALKWKISAGSAAVGIASGPNPSVNLIDFMVLASVTRMAIEEVWSATTNGPAFQPWLHASRALETNAWAAAAGTLTSEQQGELQAAIRLWWDANSDARTGFMVRPEEFSSIVRKEHEKNPSPESVFALVGLDPTAGLDPAVREVTRTRLFAERALFTAQRAPFLLRWQIELLSDQLFRGAEVQTLVDTSDRLGRAAEAATTTVAQWPDRVTAERKAILAALEEQEGKLRELSAEVGRTLKSGEKMSESLNTTLITFDALMKRFGVGEPNTDSPSDGGGEPFRILDYGQTAERLEAAAQRLTELLHAFDETLGSTNMSQLAARLAPVVDDAHARGKELVDYAFWKGLTLLAMVFAAALVYRFLAIRMAASGSR